MTREPTRDEAVTPPGLENSAAVFNRATRIARTLFGRVHSQVTLKVEDGYWRSRPAEVQTINRAAGVEAVIERGEVLWIGDARADPQYRDEEDVRAGRIRFFAGAPIRLEDGSTAGVLWVGGLEPRSYEAVLARRLQDLADFVADEWSRVRAERASAEFEHTITTLVNAMPISMVLTDREYRLLYASPPWLAARGLEGQQVVGKSLFELRPDLFEQWREGLIAAVDGEGFSVERLAMPRPDGGTDWVRVQLKPWRDHAGEVGGLVITSYDITSIVEALERSERSEDRLRLAMQLAELHVYEMDYVRRELVKVGAEDTFFDKPQTYRDLAADIWGAIDPRDRAVVQEMWERHVTLGENYRPVYRVARSDGQEVWVSGTARLIQDEAGRPLRLVGALRNVTKQKAGERALVRAKEEAEAANRAKSAFLATMSHEIRTPLNGVLGMAQALAAETDLSPTQRVRIDAIRQSGESLLAILNDVLDLSKIEAGKLALESGRFELEELAGTVQATFQAIADAKNLDFEFSIDATAKGVYEGDPVRVRQILWNLVSNALKFTERGGVKVRIGRERGALSLTVFDSGIGMNANQLAGLFRKFEQADASTTRRFGGTGLGLAICRELAELMGGSISATSAPGMGSTFTALLPLPQIKDAASRAKTRPEPKAAPQRAEAERPIRVLAAEDNAMNQLVLRTLLGQIGIEPLIVPDGQAAVEAWERDSWDVILMDVQMPVMDGPTAAGLIRTRERAEGRPRTPIIALTANAMSHQIAEYLQSGMDAFVAKPIEAGRLYETLQAAVDGGEEAGADSPAAQGML